MGQVFPGYSDVDYFADIPASKLKANSTSALREVRDALDKRFPDTGVRVSCPAVVIPLVRMLKND